MKKVGLMLFLLFLIFTSFYVIILEPRWRIYSIGSSLTRYPGNSVFESDIHETVLVNPKEGKPFIIIPSLKDNYQSANFDLIPIPAQTQLDYAVGRFVRWEKIEGSSDRYIILNHVQNGKNTERKYKVIFNPTDTPEGPTFLAVESVGWFWDIGQKNTSKYLKTSGIGLGNKELGMIWPGDAVIVLPRITTQDLSLNDTSGYYVAGKLILRRLKILTPQ